jgi:DNA-binding NarL/FixJ family response regulator
MMTRILIADDHAIVRAGLRAVVHSMPDLELIFEAASGEEAVSAAVELTPDVIVMDLQMEGMGGLEAIRRIRTSDPRARILVLTMHEDEATLLSAMTAGACGYVVKGGTYEEVSAAIVAAAAGEVVFGPAVSGFVLSTLTTQQCANSVEPALSERESEVLALLAEGRSTQQVAHALCLSPKTVRNHVSSILTKLEVPDRAHALVWARTGWTKAPGRAQCSPGPPLK